MNPEGRNGMGEAIFIPCLLTRGYVRKSKESLTLP